MLKIVLLVLALICFVVRALSIPTGRIDTMNAGFAFLVASLLV